MARRDDDPGRKLVEEKTSVLDIPIDHRLRRIIRELRTLNTAPNNSSNSSHHCEELRSLSQELFSGNAISQAEVDFACHLAEPQTRGGLVVALTQPPVSQQYNMPFEQVKDGCPTLVALRELKELFGTPFSIFDAFPFIRERYEELDDDNEDHMRSHEAFHNMIVTKRPQVVLAGWSCPSSFRPGDTIHLRKKAVGDVFHFPETTYHGINLSIVNMPHPSYYMNYHTTESCFRQLAILEFAQACGRLKGLWAEASLWQARLRARCRTRAKYLYDNKIKGNEDTVITARLKQILDMLAGQLPKIGFAFSSKSQIEHHLDKNCIAESCTDVSLILHKMADDTRQIQLADGTINSNVVDSMDAVASFLETFCTTKWPRLANALLVSASEGTPGLFDCEALNNIVISRDSPRLTRQIDYHLLDFAKEMNLTYTALQNGRIGGHVEPQAAAFFRLADGIEDTMDRTTDNDLIVNNIEDVLGALTLNSQA